jgi:hypothetical protein
MESSVADAKAPLNGAYITAEPNPVATGDGPGVTRLKWSTGDGSPGQVLLRLSIHPESLWLPPRPILKA